MMDKIHDDSFQEVIDTYQFNIKQFFEGVNEDIKLITTMDGVYDGKDVKIVCEEKFFSRFKVMINIDGEIEECDEKGDIENYLKEKLYCRKKRKGMISFEKWLTKQGIEFTSGFHDIYLNNWKNGNFLLLPEIYDDGREEYRRYSDKYCVVFSVVVDFAIYDCFVVDDHTTYEVKYKCGIRHGGDNHLIESIVELKYICSRLLSTRMDFKLINFMYNLKLECNRVKREVNSNYDYIDGLIDGDDDYYRKHYISSIRKVVNGYKLREEKLLKDIMKSSTEKKNPSGMLILTNELKKYREKIEPTLSRVSQYL